MLRLLCLTVLCCGLLGDALEADEFSESESVPQAEGRQPTDAAVRDSVARSLPFLEKVGVEWMDQRGCMSCHHVPFLLWSHRAAQSHGLAVDVGKLAEWDEWTKKDSLSHRNLFRLQNHDLGKVEAAKLPDAVKEKLKPLIEQPFKTEDEFLAKLKPLLTEYELKSYQTIVLKTAERTPYAVDRAGGGLDVLGQLLLGNRGAVSVLAQAEFRDGVIDLMSQIQLADGSWTPGNQFATMRRWSLPTANQVTTIWATLALAASEEPGTKRSATIEKAIAWQQQQSPDPDNREWLATRLLFERRFGSGDEVAKLHQQLLDARNKDGGWGWEKGVPSDPYTTGLAIYVLAKVRAGDDSAVFQDARAFLLKSQQADGSWLTPSKNITKSTEPERLKARDEIYHYWGTAWAAIGLLETLSPPKPVRFIREWGRQGNDPGDFNFPIGIAINQADEVFVTDHYNNRLQKFNSEGKLLACIETLPSPGGIAVDTAGRIYLSHFPASRLGKEKTPDRVSVLSPDGKHLREWGRSGTGDGEFSWPGGIAIGRNDRVYVADQTNRRVQVFGLDGKFAGTWGKYGTEPGQFGGNVSEKSRVGGPQFVAIDAAENVYTTEASFGRVQKFDSQGKYLLSWGDNEDKPGSFGPKFEGPKFEGTNLQGPIGICIDKEGNVWVSAAGGRIQQFSGSGQFLRGIGAKPGERPGKFMAPHGIAIDSQGRLYVVDSYNHRIQQFDVSE